MFDAVSGTGIKTCEFGIIGPLNETEKAKYSSNLKKKSVDVAVHKISKTLEAEAENENIPVSIYPQIFEFWKMGLKERVTELYGKLYNDEFLSKVNDYHTSRMNRYNFVNSEVGGK